MSKKIESREILAEKPLLTLREAAAYTGIGVNRLRDMSNEPNCDYVLFLGTKRMLKRTALLAFLEQAYTI